MRSSIAAVGLLACLAFCAACSGYEQPNQASTQLSFGVDMARRGLWEEALFRFHEAEKLDPQNPRIQSNLGVAHEAAGQFDKALDAYKKALQLAPNDKNIRTNYARFVEFYQGFKGEKTTKAADQAKPQQGARRPPPAGQPKPGAAPVPPPGEPSTPEDVPPPPADNRPPR